MRVGLPVAPGVCTPTDIELAVEEGCRLMKFFPSEPSGGLPYLSRIAAPFSHLGVKYILLGGVNAENSESYLREPSVQALVGSARVDCPEKFGSYHGQRARSFSNREKRPWLRVKEALLGCRIRHF